MTDRQKESSDDKQSWVKVSRVFRVFKVSRVFKVFKVSKDSKALKALKAFKALIEFSIAIINTLYTCRH